MCLDFSFLAILTSESSLIANWCRCDMGTDSNGCWMGNWCQPMEQGDFPISKLSHHHHHCHHHQLVPVLVWPWIKHDSRRLPWRQHGEQEGIHGETEGHGTPLWLLVKLWRLWLWLFHKHWLRIWLWIHKHWIRIWLWVHKHWLRLCLWKMKLWHRLRLKVAHKHQIFVKIDRISNIVAWSIQSTNQGINNLVKIVLLSHHLHHHGMIELANQRKADKSLRHYRGHCPLSSCDQTRTNLTLSLP